MRKTIETARVSVSLTEGNRNGKPHMEISGADLTDRFNEPRFYSKTARSWRRAWAALEKAFEADPENLTMYGAMRILGENGIRTRSYCAVD